MINNHIEVVLAPDNNYAMQCATTIASIINNTRSSIRFHILSSNLSKKNKNKIINLLKNTKHICCFYDMSKYDFSNLPMNRDYISIATYYRLKILNLIPQNISKVIYLDCDIIVKHDLNELWSTSLRGKLAGVVEDEVSLTNMKRLKLPIENNYFNAGVIVLDLEKLRNFDFENKFLEYYKANKQIITCQDQDILNGILNGYCYYLPIYWNTDGRVYSYNNTENNKTIEQMEAAIADPHIIHYTYIYKPWLVNCKHPHKKYWWNYFNKTSFKTYYIKYFCMKFLFFYQKNETHKLFRILGLKIKVKNKVK